MGEASKKGGHEIFTSFLGMSLVGMFSGIYTVTGFCSLERFLNTITRA